MMRTQTLPLSLFVFAAVFLLSSAFPQDAGNDGARSLVESRAREERLQRRKPPPSVPGPKLSPAEFNSASMVGVYEHEKKNHKPLSYSHDMRRKKYAKPTKSRSNGDVAPLKKAENSEKNLADGEEYSLNRNEKGNQRSGGGSYDLF